MRQLARYRQILCAVLLGITVSASGWAQEAEAPEEDSAAAETQAEAAAADETESEETVSEEIDVDDGSYIDAEEDDFRPSEDISADQSITFPTDI